MFDRLDAFQWRMLQNAKATIGSLDDIQDRVGLRRGSGKGMRSVGGNRKKGKIYIYIQGMLWQE